MATLIRPRLWGQQKPPAGSQINWGHPLAAGLIGYFPMNEMGGTPNNLAAPPAPVTRTPNQKWGSNGLWLNGTGPAAGWSPATWNQPTRMVTLVVDAQPTGLPATNSTSAGKTYNNNNSAPWFSYGIQYNAGGTGKLQAIAANLSTPVTATWTYSSSQILQRHQAALRWNTLYGPFNLDLIYNGVLEVSTGGPSGGSIGYDSTSTGQFLIGDNSAVSSHQPFTGNIYMVGIWNRLLSLAELQWLKAEPYAMMQPPAPMQRYWMPGAAVIIPPPPPPETPSQGGSGGEGRNEEESWFQTQMRREEDDLHALISVGVI